MDSAARRSSVISTAVACFFLCAQFWVSGDYITDILMSLGFHPNFFNDQGQRQVFSSIVLSLSIIASTWLAFFILKRFIKRNIRSYFRRFQIEIAHIAQYHSEQISLISTHKAKHNIDTYKSDFDFVWIDFILTDIRKAISELYGHKEIRVSVFVEHHYAEYGESYMVFAQSSSFRNNPPTPVQFAKGSGFCGCAWRECKPICGNSSKSFLTGRIDHRYLKMPGDTDSMSFLCVPLTVRQADGKIKCRGVLSIDSTIRSDFTLNDDMANSIATALDSVNNLLTRHILDERYILDDRRPLEQNRALPGQSN